MNRFGRRRLLETGLGVAGLGLLLGCGVRLPAMWQAKLARIGYLAPEASPAAGSVSPTSGPTPFVQGLRDLGYVEGETFEMVYRFADEREDHLPALAAELAALPVDVIVAAGTVAARAAKDTTGIVPVVFSTSNDPIEAGLVDTLARPGGNVTGLSLANSTLVAKRLELLKQMVPLRSRLAVLVYAPGATSSHDWHAAQTGGHALGLQLTRYDVGSADDFDAAFSAIATAKDEALLILSNRFFTASPRNRERLLTLAALHRLPAISDTATFARAGGLMSYGANTADLTRRAATYVDKILQGARPADLPVEQPTKFDFVVNLKTAQALGLTIRQTVLEQATEIIS